MITAACMSVVAGICCCRLRQATTMKDISIRNRSRRRTPWTGDESATPLQRFIEDRTRIEYDSKHSPIAESGECGFLNSLAVSTCRRCGSGSIRKRGMTRNGLQRYYCSSCNKSFSILTGTLFDSHKLPIHEWIGFLLDIFGFSSMNLASKGNRNSSNTTRYWMDKLFLALDGIQDDIVLRDEVWIDETFYRLRKPDIQKDSEGNEYRGLSRNQMCIAIGCDKDNVICIYEGNGKPSKKRTEIAFSSHIEQGSHLIHDCEKSHSILLERLSLSEEIHDSRGMKGLDDEANPMRPVNDKCRLLKMFLDSHPGFSRDELQGYLNLFCFIMNPPSDKYRKIEKLLIRMIENPKLLRYRCKNLK